MFKMYYMEEWYYCSPLGVSKTLRGWKTLVSFYVAVCLPLLLLRVAGVSWQILITYCRASQQS